MGFALCICVHGAEFTGHLPLATHSDPERRGFTTINVNGQESFTTPHSHTHGARDSGPPIAVALLQLKVKPRTRENF